MNLEQMAAQVGQHFTVTNVVLFIALVATTVMAENQKIKASSIYGLARTLLLTFIDQVKPQPNPTPVPASVPDSQATLKQ